MATHSIVLELENISRLATVRIDVVNHRRDGKSLRQSCKAVGKSRDIDPQAVEQMYYSRNYDMVRK